MMFLKFVTRLLTKFGFDKSVAFLELLHKNDINLCFLGQLTIINNVEVGIIN